VKSVSDKNSEAEPMALTEAAARRRYLLAFLENRVWPNLPEGASRPWSKEEEERALGFGEHGECV
jgi:hypothetical protein